MRKLAFLMFLATPLLAQFDPVTFQSPPVQYRGHAMWSFPLSTLSESYITSGIEEMAKLNYGGFFIEPGGGPTTGLSDQYIKLFRRGQADSRGVVYLSDEYFRYYKLAMEEAKKRGMEVVLYDDYSFPTGTVGGQLFSKYPQYAAKSLEMTERDVTGPAKVELAFPQGIYMGAVMMNRDTFDLVDISDRRAQSRNPSAQGQLESDGVLPHGGQGSRGRLSGREGHGHVHFHDISEVSRKPGELLRKSHQANLLR
jgi:hypothetical protein